MQTTRIATFLKMYIYDCRAFRTFDICITVSTFIFVLIFSFRHDYRSLLYYQNKFRLADFIYFASLMNKISFHETSIRDSENAMLTRKNYSDSGVSIG